MKLYNSRVEEGNRAAGKMGFKSEREKKNQGSIATCTQLVTLTHAAGAAAKTDTASLPVLARDTVAPNRYRTFVTAHLLNIGKELFPALPACHLVLRLACGIVIKASLLIKQGVVPTLQRARFESRFLQPPPRASS